MLVRRTSYRVWLASLRENSDGEYEEIVTRCETIEESEWSYPALAANSVLAVLMTVCILILCERLLRESGRTSTDQRGSSLHPFTWCVVALVLGGFVALNQPRGHVQNEFARGWPLTSMRVYPTPFGSSDVSIPVNDDSHVSYFLRVELTTERSYPALLIDGLIALLTTAMAGIIAQRLLRSPAASPPPSFAGDEPERND